MLQSSQLIQEVMQEKLRSNPRYSLRAAARDLKISHGYLSQILQGKKRLTFQRTLQFIQFLKIDECRASLLLRAVSLESTRDDDCRAYLEKVLSSDKSNSDDSFAVLELDRFKILSEWHHVAILDLTTIQGFRSDAVWVAEELGITTEQVESAVARLIRVGLLEMRGRKWVKTQAKLAVPTTHTDRAIREFHTQMIEKAQEALQSNDPDDFAARDISGITMAINPARIPEAKRKIQKFRREMLEFLEVGTCTELYQMNVQLFRLNRRRKK